MGKQGDRKARKQRAQEREQHRRQASGNREPGPEAFGIKMPPPAAPGAPAQRPDYSETDWDALRAAYPRDAERVKRAMFIAFVGERAKQAKGFLAWGLRPNSFHPDSRFARDNAAVTLDDEPNLVSSTALYPTMNASEHLVAAAEVIALALTQGQMRTSALAALCRIAMESSAKTIWLIRETDTDERLRRCYGFIKGERGRQEQFEGLEAEALEARTDPLADAQRVKFEKHCERSAARHEQIQALPAEALTGPPGPLELVEGAEDWMDEHLPREPDPELGKVIHPRSAKSFYSLSSGFVHGFKWQAEYLFDSSGELDDSGLLEVTLDALGNAIRMTGCAVALHEAQSVGSRPDPRRVRNYPAGLADYVKDLSPLYQ
jgi:hypothetical protein